MKSAKTNPKHNKNALILHLNYSEDHVQFKESNLLSEIDTNGGAYNPNPDTPVDPAPEYTVLAPFHHDSRFENEPNLIVAYNDFSDLQKPVHHNPSIGKRKEQEIPETFITTNDGSQVKEYVRGLRNFLTGPNGDIWPSSTSIHCWHCCHPFSTMPIGLPIKLIPTGTYSERHELYKFLVYGVFCSPSCALAYSCDHTNSVPVVDRLGVKQLLVLMMKRLTGSKTITLTPAPSRLVLSTFGGDMTIEQFRSCSDSNFVYGLYIQPLVPMRFDMECLTSIEKKYRPIPKASDSQKPAEKAHPVQPLQTAVPGPSGDAPPTKRKRGAPAKKTADITNYFDMS